jgi:GINS complex subunit 2
MQMPSEHYMVIAKLIFGNASDDVSHVDEIKTLIKDIYDIRLSKLRAAINSQVDKNANPNSENNPTISYTNLTIQEINTVKPFLPFATDLVARLERAHLQHTSNINNSTRLSNF